MTELEQMFRRYYQTLMFPSGIYDHYEMKESRCTEYLLEHYQITLEEKEKIDHLARTLVASARDSRPNGISFESFFKEYNLGTEEGAALMCMAEAFLRVPDSETARLFLEDKLHQGQWQIHLGNSPSFWVNASTWGLIISGKVFKPTPEHGAGILRQVIRKLGGPFAQKALHQAMNLMGDQFVLGQTIGKAWERSRDMTQYLFSFDMLGEAALTFEGAAKYFKAYEDAIIHIANMQEAPCESGISIKLSALHPRFDPLKKQAMEALGQRLKQLALIARECQVPITIDAEECYRLEATLRLFADLFQLPEFEDWPHLGLAVQAYQKRALPVLHWLKTLARQGNKKIPVRLVKGAYWDAEIKTAQQHGLKGFPVFTQKAHTDISFLVCADYLLQQNEYFYPQLATHNAHTIAAVLTKAQTFGKSANDFELQRLYGMGAPIYNKLKELSPQTRVRIYAPVGKHVDLLPYLVRRLLENGANSSFINGLNNASVPVQALIEDPRINLIKQKDRVKSPIKLPGELFLPERINASGINFNCEREVQDTLKRIQPFIEKHYGGTDQDQTIRNPALRSHILGTRQLASAGEIQEALKKTDEFFPVWKNTPAGERASLLEKLANLIEENRYELMALLMMECGKTLPNARNEVREAVDMCRYYAVQCRKHFTVPTILPGPTGERNTQMLEGKGVFLCISPWNFPLAIFVGQISAALAAGNCVIAKPAQHGELVARKMAELFYSAGFPQTCLYFAPCSARVFATLLLSDDRVAGVAFTGSVESAQSINRQLAQREGSIATFIAETGGQNAMIVDSTALPEQVALDVITSAFDSAGQRCSALRVLFLQEEVADRILELIIGQMQTLKVGNPLALDTDIGPVINDTAQASILAHIERISTVGKRLAQTPVEDALYKQGYFVPPTLIEIETLQQLTKEVFGPALHVIRFKSDQSHQVIKQINESCYGLTFGIHTRIDSRAEELSNKVMAGNIYINRNMIGANVGSQPFGGLRLSGTGPQAGGPHYLTRFANEKSVCNNIAAIGGNTELLAAYSPYQQQGEDEFLG